MFFTAGVHRFFFLFGIVTLAFGVMLGAVPTSVPQFILLINWLLEGGYAEKFRRLRFNRVFWALELLFGIHFIGLFYSTDFLSALKDLQIKLPLFILPLVFFSSEPLSRKEITLTFKAFLFGCLINTAWCLIYSFGLHNNEIGRNTSRFMSHIRLGLYLNMAILICAQVIKSKLLNRRKWLYALLAVYFVVVLFLLGLATGVLILVFLLFAASLYGLSQSKIVYKLSLLFIVAILSFMIWDFLNGVYSNQLIPRDVPNNKILNQTIAGNPYIYLDTVGRKENGHYIYINLQLDELQETWNYRSPEDTFSLKNKHNVQRYEALIRYLSGLGLNKDSVGVMALSANDLNSIKRNVPNHLYNNWSFMHQRVYELVNEFDDFKFGRNVNGKSVTMRYYFWKAAVFAIKSNFWFGVGTGDVQSQMEKSYVSSLSPLNPEWYKRPHNQFLTVFVALGVVGLALFLLGLFYPPYRLHRRLSKLYFGFMLVYLVSFLFEDTIETQAGATFFAFFNTFLLAEAFFKRPQNFEHSQPNH